MKTPLKSVHDFCVECAGGPRDDIVLCAAFDCPLWPYRLGCRPSSPAYASRVKAALDGNGAMVKDLRALGVDLSRFIFLAVRRREKGKKSGGRDKQAAQSGLGSKRASTSNF